MAAAFPIDKLIGAALIGFIFGITWLQVYAYYTKYCIRDGLFLKIFVAVLMALDTFHAVLVLVIVYHYAISNFGDYTTLERGTWGLIWQSFVGVSMASLGNLQGIIQMSFAYRIYNRYSSAESDFLFSTGDLLYGKNSHFTRLQLEPLGTRAGPELKKWAISTLGCAITCDLMIASCTVHYLRKRNANFKGTRSAVRLLITYALNTCLLTSVFNLVTMMMWIQESKTMLYDLFFFIAVRQMESEFITMSDLVTYPPSSNGTRRPSDRSDAPAVREINVHIEQHTTVDWDSASDGKADKQGPNKSITGIKQARQDGHITSIAEFI
ncbi:hypothetical protein C8J56DRAFT_902050 [Mycena floridula]|nr:hypothetical protein C8J56DRAFT_902050 [Mycena floridula]